MRISIRDSFEGFHKGFNEDMGILPGKSLKESSMKNLKGIRYANSLREASMEILEGIPHGNPQGHPLWELP